MSKNLQKKSKRTFAALNDYVQVEPIEAAGGGTIALAELKKETAIGKVVSVGPGVLETEDGKMRNIPRVKKGDVVGFNPHLVHEIKVEGKAILVISFNAIYGKYE